MLKYPPYSLFAGTELPLKWTQPVSQEQSWDALNSLKGGCSTAAMCLRTVCSPYAQPSLMVSLLQSYINQSPSHSQCGTGQGNTPSAPYLQIRPGLGLFRHTGIPVQMIFHCLVKTLVDLFQKVPGFRGKSVCEVAPGCPRLHWRVCV